LLLLPTPEFGVLPLKSTLPGAKEIRAAGDHVAPTLESRRWTCCLTLFFGSLADDAIRTAPAQHSEHITTRDQAQGSSSRGEKRRKQ
jgi:hypothetical protein